MSTIPSLPEHLSPGLHLSPEDGACLMETVSLVCGEHWTDAPQCVHPLVAHLARIVNDSVSDDARDRLLILVPLLTKPARQDDASYAEVAYACTSWALHTGSSPLLTHLHRVNAAQLAGRATSARTWRMPALLYRRGPAFRSVDAAARICRRISPSQRDDALIQLLLRAMAVASAAPHPLFAQSSS